MPPTVSVVLCTFDGARYVERQVESILTQSRPIDELVVSDDGSSDDTVERVRAVHARLAPELPLVLLQNERPLGVVGNFEQAMRAAHGGLIALADQDDVWHPHRIRSAVDAFAADPGLMVVHSDAALVDAAEAPLGGSLLDALEVADDDRAALRSGDAFGVLLRRNLATGTTMTLDARLLPVAIPFPPDWVHDEWLAAVGAAIGRLRLIETPLVDYRQHGGNQIGASSLTASSAIARLRTSRTARNKRLLERATALAERMPELQPSPGAERVRLAQQKLAHERRRSAYPASRLRRIAPVWRAWRAGGYRRFGLGAQDVLRDLVQPV